MQSVLVGSDLNGCAFVCGSLSFLDKISCGLALYTLQSYQSKLSSIARPVPIFSSPAEERERKIEAARCFICMIDSVNLVPCL